MKKSIYLILITCGIAMQVSAQSGQLQDLTMIKKGVKSKRISSYDRSGGNNDRKEHIKNGEKFTLCDIKGAGIINHIWITISPQSINRNDIILRMYWDGNTAPSVNSPIGPFFGQGWDERYNYVSMPLAASPVGGNALVSYFSMPFEKGARIEIENQTGKEIEAFYYYVDYVEVEKLPVGTGRFHAWYNHQVTEALAEGENEWGTINSVNGNNLDGKRNYVMADIKGKGHFVGVNYYVNSPSPMWYGEGDDMIFIDGDTVPTLNGTGTEDYFNTSWCPKEPYSHPQFGYPRINTGETGWLGRTHVYRFHITDPIYFDKALKFTIEHGHNNCLTLDLASVAYWYLDKASPVPAIADKEARKPKGAMGTWDIHLWRHEWRKSRGSKGGLWGNE